MKSLQESLKNSINKSKSNVRDKFLKLYPDAEITEKKNKDDDGDVIVYVNGQTAYNKSNMFSVEDMLSMMKNAYKRSLNK